MKTVLKKSQKLKVAFGPQKKGDFYSVVKDRVEAYFSNAQKSRNANGEMVLKTAILATLYLLLYMAILSDRFEGGLLIGLYSALGVTMGLIGFNFCHDVMHGAYFKKPSWNKIFCYAFDFNGMSSFVWKITHNVHHHSFTNIHGLDGDIDKAILLRLSPHDPYRSFHKFQFLYAPLLYSLVSLNWTVYSDYSWFYQELKKREVSWSEIGLFFLFKSINLFLLLVLPILLLTAPVWQIVLGFLCLHFAGGVTSALVFQMGHVIEGVEFPELTQQGNIDIPWAEHEMATTSNFGTNMSIWGVLFGGLNYQIEHHLFPFVCHVHYPYIAPIVKQTAKEFGLPYHEQPSFLAAILSHFKLLIKFGKLD